MTAGGEHYISRDKPIYNISTNPQGQLKAKIYVCTASSLRAVKVVVRRVYTIPKAREQISLRVRRTTRSSLSYESPRTLYPFH